MTLLEKLFKLFMGDPQAKIIKHYQPFVDSINAQEATLQALSDDQLKEKTDTFKDRLSQGESLDDLLPESFAVVREAAKRVLGMRHFDVQLVGGVVLHEGRIAEMKTGEGKTLVATLSAYLNALEGKGVYIVTVNDYLAKRDSEWMGQVYQFLGLSVGLIQSGMGPEDKIKAYAADITFGTNNEFGFDYLRDNLSWDLTQCCQNRRHYAIIDEVDSILIDEARTPLIISGPIQESTAQYVKVAKVVKTLKVDTHFTLDEKHKNVVLTDEGIDAIEDAFKIQTIYSVENMSIAHMSVQCLKALHCFKKDVDYVVKNNEIMIVDEFTGRLMEGRRYSDGLHQSIEAIEGVDIKEESQTLASITFQNYFRMFPKLAGMTGTALTEASEFESIYGLSVVPIPTNKPVQRQDKADLVYKSKKEKFEAISEEIKILYEKGQPVLVGTIAIETSEYLSGLLKQKKIPHSVLNAKQHQKEAEIIANAGQKKSVTIATNMAGRGTDIVLGEGVKELGGLFVLGSGRHESRRIDNQLRGRSGRQGDPGDSRFFVCLEDDLMRMFGSDRIAKVMETLNYPENTPIENKLVSKSIENAQSKVEKYHFGIRKQILEYDDVSNRQRETIYAIRRGILEGKKLDSIVKDGLSEIVTVYVNNVAGKEGINTPEQIQELTDAITQIFPMENLDHIVKPNDKVNLIKSNLKEALMRFYQFRKTQFPEGIFEEVVTKRLLLSTVDRQWLEHLHNMDILREGIGLRAWGQRNPLVEFKREAYAMFKELLLAIYEDSFKMISRATLVEDERPRELLDSNKIVGRNDPCPCGSGKKHKKCCMS